MVFFSAEGQTCNQFFILRQHIADCIKKNKKLYILAPDITIKDYHNLRNSKYLKFPFYRERITRAIGYKNNIELLKLLFRNKGFLHTAQLLNLVPGVRFIYGKVGKHKSPYLEENIESIKQLFIPSEEIVAEVNTFMSQLRESYHLIIGIHIRRGDYKTHKHGRFYYSIAEYNRIIQQFKSTFRDKSVLFFISSDENINLQEFTDCSCIKMENGSAVKDLYALSHCDYIVGPPSSFSGWASFMGNKPIFFIKDPLQKILLSDFKNFNDSWSQL